MSCCDKITIETSGEAGGIVRGCAEYQSHKTFQRRRAFRKDPGELPVEME